MNPHYAIGEPREFLFTHAAVVGGGLMLAGICWEVRGWNSRVTECTIFWFAMFSYYDGVVNLLDHTNPSEWNV